MTDLKRTIEILKSQKQSIIEKVYKTGNSCNNNDYIGFTGTSGTISFYVSEGAWNEIKKIMISDYDKRISELEKKVMLNPHKKVSVRLEDGTEIKSFETISQARDRAKWESKMKRMVADIIVNDSIFESYDDKGIIM